MLPLERRHDGVWVLPHDDVEGSTNTFDDFAHRLLAVLEPSRLPATQMQSCALHREVLPARRPRCRTRSWAERDAMLLPLPDCAERRDARARSDCTFPSCSWTLSVTLVVCGWC